jgi:hypothetical protein
MAPHVGITRLTGLLIWIGLIGLAAPAPGQTKTVADLLAGKAVPLTVKLKEITPEWRRVTITGEAMLGMGGMMQSMMQGVGSMFGGGSNDALYTRGQVISLGLRPEIPGFGEYLVGYRLPSQGVDFASLIAMGAAGAGAAGGPPGMPERKPITGETDLSLVLINLKNMASISDIRPFNLEEALKPPSGSLLDLMRQAGTRPGQRPTTPAPRPAPKRLGSP